MEVTLELNGLSVKKKKKIKYSKLGFKPSLSLLCNIQEMYKKTLKTLITLKKKNPSLNNYHLALYFILFFK